MFITTCSSSSALFSLAARASGASGAVSDPSSAEAASLSALLAATTTAPSSAADAASASTNGASDEAMTGILSVQRQQLRARIDHLEREAASHRRRDRVHVSFAFNVSQFLPGSKRRCRRNCRV
jgi:hypothetical protein